MRAVHNRCFFVEILSLYQHTLELVLDVFILNIHFSSNVPDKSFFLTKSLVTMKLFLIIHKIELTYEQK